MVAQGILADKPGTKGLIRAYQAEMLDFLLTQRRVWRAVVEIALLTRNNL